MTDDRRPEAATLEERARSFDYHDHRLGEIFDLVATHYWWQFWGWAGVILGGLAP